MKKEEINRAIAEHFGLLVAETQRPESLWPDVLIAKAANVALTPNYCGDLNEMHEDEKTLTGTQQDDYRDTLKDVCFKQWQSGKAPRVHAVFATADQRAEAFLRTIGKWREDEHPIADPPKVCDTPRQEEQ